MHPNIDDGFSWRAMSARELGNATTPRQSMAQAGKRTVMTETSKEGRVTRMAVSTIRIGNTYNSRENQWQVRGQAGVDVTNTHCKSCFYLFTSSYMNRHRKEPDQPTSRQSGEESTWITMSTLRFGDATLPRIPMKQGPHQIITADEVDDWNLRRSQLG